MNALRLPSAPAVQLSPVFRDAGRTYVRWPLAVRAVPRVSETCRPMSPPALSFALQCLPAFELPPQAALEKPPLHVALQLPLTLPTTTSTTSLLGHRLLDLLGLPPLGCAFDLRRPRALALLSPFIMRFGFACPPLAGCAERRCSTPPRSSGHCAPASTPLLSVVWRFFPSSSFLSGSMLSGSSLDMLEYPALPYDSASSLLALLVFISERSPTHPPHLCSSALGLSRLVLPLSHLWH